MNLVYLAQRIREFRKKRMLTLEQLADRAQLTQSVLSKVENSRVTPSLAALGRIAEALGVTLSELVAGIEQERRMTVVRRDERPLVQRGNGKGAAWRSMAPTRRAKQLEPFLLELPPGGKGQEKFAQGGDEFLLVLKGSITVECGEETCTLEAGDAVYLDAGEECRLVNAGKGPAEVLCVFSGQHPLALNAAEAAADRPADSEPPGLTPARPFLRANPPTLPGRGPHSTPAAPRPLPAPRAGG
jgi:transcriptional regulator with XRE-family HTH domain